MTVVISDDFSLSLSVRSEYNSNNPIIGYHSLTTASNIFTTTQDDDFPASNMGNVSTNSKWIGLLGSPSLDEEYITIIAASIEDIDYVAVAKHNFGTGKFPVSIEGLAEEDGSPAEWFELVSDVLLPNDNPVIFRFTPQSLYAVRIRLQPSIADAPPAPTAAVVFVGTLLILQRRIYVGHTPIPYGRRTKVTNARSESGNFLGRVVLNEMKMSTIQMDNITPGWYRSYLDPFIIHAQEFPFFFNWRPGSYQFESGFCWMSGDAEPVNQRPNGMMQIKMEVTGIA